ncbi:MAG: hypothetical protein KGH61_00340 [Candidatus Micrarchaeota archaeon]|nr:hypothetical protein [Candidatus Micrarchaeota archaeon]MDE1864000.1 hypothetical protein [Candidatus Micrarchaeota archaeon]
MAKEVAQKVKLEPEKKSIVERMREEMGLQKGRAEKRALFENRGQNFQPKDSLEQFGSAPLMHGEVEEIKRQLVQGSGELCCAIADKAVDENRNLLSLEYCRWILRYPDADLRETAASSRLLMGVLAIGDPEFVKSLVNDKNYRIPQAVCENSEVPNGLRFWMKKTMANLNMR